VWLLMHHKAKKEADMMFWAVLIFVLLAFSDLILPDFTKPAKESMTQYMVCAVLTLVVILKLAQAASQPGESWRQFKNLFGLSGTQTIPRCLNTTPKRPISRTS
jgi:hypothetical protein